MTISGLSVAFLQVLYLMGAKAQVPATLSFYDAANAANAVATVPLVSGGSGGGSSGAVNDIAIDLNVLPSLTALADFPDGTSNVAGVDFRVVSSGAISCPTDVCSGQFLYNADYCRRADVSPYSLYGDSGGVLSQPDTDCALPAATQLLIRVVVEASQGSPKYAPYSTKVNVVAATPAPATSTSTPTSAPATSTPTSAPTIATTKEVAKLTTSDVAAGDWFGRSVAISGNLAVVGAPGDDHAGYDSGSAFAFQTLDGGTTWDETAKLTASDAAMFHKFGTSVAVSGNLLVAGAFKTITSFTDSAYTFQTLDDGATWTETAQLTASDVAGDDQFGYAVAVSENLLVVGAYGSDAFGTSSGAAYVLETTDDGATWSDTAKLTASDAGEGDRFGFSVAVSGSLLIVGAPLKDAQNAGCAYAFRTLDGGTTWNETAKLTASNAAAADQFGNAVAISGNLAVVGAVSGDGELVSDCGAAYLFQTLDGGATWKETAKLTATDAAREDYFGWSVAISGSVAVVGAIQPFGGQRGSAYVFETTDDGATWTETAKLAASDAGAGARFGTSVAVSGNLAVVGTSFNAAAYVFLLP